MKTKQFEITWDRPEPFALAVETTQDGERIASEQQKREADRKAAENNQTELLP